MTRTNEATTNARRLKSNTRVVSMLDGESGRIISTLGIDYRRAKVTSCVVQTQYGREVWKASDLFLPDAQS